MNLETTFYTRAASIDRTMTIVGFSVTVHLEPTAYTWHWGDGSTTTTQTPGQPYPSTDVTHTYVHATEEGTGLPLSVDITYSARYRVDGGAWQAIPDSLTIPGTTSQLPVKQAAAVLVSND